MARIRTIKPDFWKNEELAEVPPETVLLAIGLLNYCDDEGYFNANPALIKAEVFPIRKTSGIDTVLLPELSRIGYIELFLGSDNKKYGRVKNFLIHQVINKPKPSKIKPLCGIPDEYGSSTVGVRVGKEGKGREDINKKNKEKVTLETLSVNHIENWLAEKRKQGKFVNHKPEEVLEIFKNYCQANGRQYSDYVAAYRNAFAWEQCQPKENKDGFNRGNNQGDGTQGGYQRPAGRSQTDKIIDGINRVAEKYAGGGTQV